MKTTLALAALLAISTPLAADKLGEDAGIFPAGERWTPPVAHAPAHTSRMHVTTITPTAGEAKLEVPAGGRSPLLLWVVPRADAASNGKERHALPSKLKSPSGKSVDAELFRAELSAQDTDLGLPDGQEALRIETPEPGLFTLELDAKDAAAVTVIAAEPDSPLALSTWAGPLSRRAGEDIVLFARLLDGARVPNTARVTARLASPDGDAGRPIELHDDGKHGDGAKDDGLYAASAKVHAEKPGFWTVLFTADGRDASGQAFARTSTSGFVSEPSLGRLLPGLVARVTTNGGARVVRVEGAADLLESGDYRLEAVVSGAASADGSRPAISWAERTDRASRGRAPLALDVPLPEGATGELHVEVRVLGLSQLGLVAREEMTAR